MSIRETQVLIVGAGPTGLMLAGWLTRQGIDCLVIDKKSGLSRESRALAVQARTLELYDQLGIGDEALEQGLPARAINLWVRRGHIGRAPFSEMGRGVSPHPYVFVLGQDKNERLLLKHLEARGRAVEWRTGLTGLTQDEQGISAQIQPADGSQATIRARYVCGCDGAGSPLRHALGIGFHGGTYGQLFFVADVSVTGALRQEEINLCFDDDRFQAFFPMPGRNHFRIVGIVPPELADQPGLRFEQLRERIEGNFAARIRECFWFSTYHVHHRVAERFQQGRAFLLGDAAHIHSPAGGQGMNTGLMDAVNLAWKLALVIKDQADESLLASYAAERMPFARALVGTTDRAFGLATSRAPGTRLLRTLGIPMLFRLGTLTAFAPRRIFALVSQTRVKYSESPLSQGHVGSIRAGERLPWLPLAVGSNYTPLRQMAFQFQVYGTPNPQLEAFAAARGYPLVRLPLTGAALAAGYKPGAVYFVRPDGYLSYVSEGFDAADFESYLARTGLSRTPEP